MEIYLHINIIVTFYVWYTSTNWTIIKHFHPWQSDGNCAPGCVEQNKNATCPPGLFGISQERCVQVADCNCRLSNGQALPVCDMFWPLVVHELMLWTVHFTGSEETSMCECSCYVLDSVFLVHFDCALKKSVSLLFWIRQCLFWYIFQVLKTWMWKYSLSFLH